MDTCIQEELGVQEDRVLQEELKRSVEEGFSGFFLQYQPQIECVEYELFGLEALLRFRSAEGGIIPPDKFIPLLESAGLMVSVGDWVLETAMRQCAA